MMVAAFHFSGTDVFQKRISVEAHRDLFSEPNV